MLSRFTILFEVSVVDDWLVGVVSIKPKSSEFVGGVCWIGFEFVLNSTKPSLFVGTTMSFLGILTTPRF